MNHSSDANRNEAAQPPGYYGRPAVKPPVWTWEVPAYFFLGGLSGMAAMLGAVGWLTGAPMDFLRCAAWIAATGAIVSPILLTLDLGRPQRFLMMLRVFKRQSPMSVGAWALAVFSGAAILGAMLLEGSHQLAGEDAARRSLAWIPLIIAAAT
ncbi:MAG: polysulfide reductase NrfD, partial [Planctomycetales bacterium]